MFVISVLAEEGNAFVDGFNMALLKWQDVSQAPNRNVYFTMVKASMNMLHILVQASMLTKEG